MDDRHSAMESRMDSTTEVFFLMEDKGALAQPKTPNSAVENDDRTISVQVLEFKTSLLEAVEELHIHRDAETRYEEQICKLVLEKQELEWQTESLKSHISKMSTENLDSLAAVKKQFQAQIKASEVEKGKSQLAAELKDKEIISLKEELKQLQLLRYSLEKKLGELEQKLQLQIQTKDSHLNQLGEVERRFATISRQCAMVKQAHEKLEQNVEEAMRINKKLTSINEKQESAIKALKEDFERVNKELVTFKVSSACKSGEERMQDILKEQQFQQLQQRLFVETELNKKLSIETAKERADKQEVVRSLNQSQSLLQTQTEVLCRTEQELRTLHEEYQVLKTEHELNQERTKEKEDSFARLRDEYQNSKLTWEQEILTLQMSMKTDQEELVALKEAYYLLQEEQKHLSTSAVDKAQDNHNSELALKDQENSLSTSSNEINLVKVSSLCKGLEESHISPHDNSEPACHPDKDVLDESQTAKKDGCVHNDNTATQSTLSQSIESDNISRPEDVNAMTNHLSESCDETNVGVSESEPVCNASDKRCPSNPTQSDTDSGLTKLSGLETRSVYGVDSYPLALELKDRPMLKNLCTSEVTEPQTSDKHMDSLGYATSLSNKFKDHQNTIPEFLDHASQKESQTTLERLSDDKTENTHRQETEVFYDKRTLVEKTIATRPHTSYEMVHKFKVSPVKVICEASQTLDSQVDGSEETSFYEVKSKQLPLVDQNTLLTLVEVIFENDTQKYDDISDSEPQKSQQTEQDVASEDPKTTNPDRDPFSPASTILKHLSVVDQKNISEVDTSNHPENQRYQSSFPLDPLVNQTSSVDTKLVILENGQKDDSQPLKAQQTEPGVSSEEPETRQPDREPFYPESSIVKGQSDVDQKNISEEDTSNHPEDQKHQSSFPLDPLVNQTTSVDTKQVLIENGQKDDSQPLKAQQTELGISSEEPKTIQPVPMPLSPESTILKGQSDVDQNDISEVDASNHLGITKSLSPLVDRTPLVTSIKTMEDIFKSGQKDDWISDSEPLKLQQIELGFSSEELKKANPDQNPSSPRSTMVKDQSEIDQKHISEVHTLHHFGSGNPQSSFAWGTLDNLTTSVTSVNTVKGIFENCQKVNRISDSEPLKAQQTELRSSSNEPKTIQPGREPSWFLTVKEQSNNQKSISEVDAMNHPETRRYQSSFAWDTFMKGNKKPHQIPSRPELWPSGFRKQVSPFCAPLFTKEKLSKRAITKIPDRMDSATKHLQKSDSQEEWNAIKHSFSEILIEKENPVLIPYSFTRSSSPVSFSMGNGLRQDCTPTAPPTKLQSLEKQAQTETSSFEGKDERKQSDILAQIAKIKEFMSNEGLVAQKRRKIE